MESSTDPGTQQARTPMNAALAPMLGMPNAAAWLPAPDMNVFSVPLTAHDTTGKPLQVTLTFTLTPDPDLNVTPKALTHPSRFALAPNPCSSMCCCRRRQWASIPS